MAELRAPSRSLDKKRIERLMEAKRDGVLCFTDGKHPYGIPMPPLYFGTNPTGRKFEYFKKCKNVCYTIFHYYLKPGDARRQEGWWSIVLDGELSHITDAEELKEVLEMLFEEDIAPGFREKKNQFTRMVLQDPANSNFFKMKITHFGGKELPEFIPGDEIKG
jgi:nitroimidazol reductase NimA-like FMN-containing flavoprotein (pyridoxamine 5'-phosphate oxidase superfamily)